ncbi:MAG: hypothetical protein Q9193_004207 [Seirophora villosa]
MAPVPTTESSSAPLADWFFITGVDSEQLSWGSPNNAEEIAQDSPQLPVEQTIEEERLSESENERPEVTPRTPRHLKRNSYQRLSRLSDEARLSIASISLSPDRKGTDSNRSSTTIKGFQINSNTTTLSDVDFDRALRRFATERDSFLTDLNLSAGAVVPNRPKARPKTQRIVNNEDGGGLKSGVGSIRRRISFRDMNTMKRQSSVNRQRGLFLVHDQLLSSATSSDIVYALQADTDFRSFSSYVETPKQL